MKFATENVNHSGLTKDDRKHNFCTSVMQLFCYCASVFGTLDVYILIHHIILSERCIIGPKFILQHGNKLKHTATVIKNKDSCSRWSRPHGARISTSWSHDVWNYAGTTFLPSNLKSYVQVYQEELVLRPSVDLIFFIALQMKFIDTQKRLKYFRKHSHFITQQLVTCYCTYIFYCLFCNYYYIHIILYI